jgi:RNA polymerase sigma-70 factor (ECF subfamily)
MTQMSDADSEALSAQIDRAKRGDPHAFDSLIESCRDTIYRLAYRITCDREDAEDLTQETFVRVYRQLSKFRGESDFAAWVYRIGLNVCITARKRRKLDLTDLESLRKIDAAPGPEAWALGRELQERVTDEIHRLRPADRKAVLLRVAGELPYDEIAEILHVTPNAARLRVHRGMSRLRERLRPYLSEGEEFLK